MVVVADLSHNFMETKFSLITKAKLNPCVLSVQVVTSSILPNLFSRAWKWEILEYLDQ